MTIARDNIIIADGFAFLDDAIVDQHFLRRKRHNRLMSLVIERAAASRRGSTSPRPSRGAGRPLARSRRERRGWFTSARRSASTAPGATLGATGIVVHVLPAGSRFSIPRTGRGSAAVEAHVIPAGAKRLSG